MFVKSNGIVWFLAVSWILAKTTMLNINKLWKMLNTIFSGDLIRQVINNNLLKWTCKNSSLQTTNSKNFLTINEIRLLASFLNRTAFLE